MPLMLAGLYLELKFLNSQQAKHAPWVAYFYGIILGSLAFIRLNNAVVLCALLLCIAISLMQKKQYVNLLNNMALGLLGLATVAVPVCMYFYRRGALDDMLYATFLHNLIYAQNKTHDPIFSTNFLHYLILFLPGICSFIIFLNKWKAEKCRVYASLLVATVLTYTMLAYTNIYAHYFMLGLPLFLVAVAVWEGDNSVINVWNRATMIFSKEKNKANSAISALLVLTTVIFAGLSAYSACAPIYKTYLTDIAYDEYAQVQKGVSVIPEEERNSVICYDILANYYYHADLVPCYKYYTLQKWMTTDKVNVNEEFMKYVADEHPLWVVIPNGESNQELMRILESFYSCKSMDSIYSYYRYLETAAS